MHEMGYSSTFYLIKSNIKKEEKMFLEYCFFSRSKDNSKSLLK